MFYKIPRYLGIAKNAGYLHSGYIQDNILHFGIRSRLIGRGTLFLGLPTCLREILVPRNNEQVCFLNEKTNRL